MTSRREISRRDVTEASKTDVATWQRSVFLTSRREISRRDVTERVTQDLLYNNTLVFENSPRINFPLTLNTLQLCTSAFES